MPDLADIVKWLLALAEHSSAELVLALAELAPESIKNTYFTQHLLKEAASRSFLDCWSGIDLLSTLVNFYWVRA